MIGDVFRISLKQTMELLQSISKYFRDKQLILKACIS